MSRNVLILLAVLGSISVLILVFSVFKPPAGGVPPAASGLTAVNQPSAATPSIKLDWVDNASNETGYKIWRKPTGDTTAPFVVITTTAANVTTYTDSGLQPYWEYTYRLNATNATGDSPDSNTATAQALLAATTPPPDGGTPPTGGPPPTGGISVKDHGAKGDGTTDDKAAIQNTINACTASVLFPAGTYKVSGTLSLKANCTFYGEGSPKLVGYTGTGAGGYSIAKTAGSNIKIQNLTFEGGGVDLSVEMQSHIVISGNKFQNITNSNTNFGSAWAGVWVGGTIQDSSIDHNAFYNILDGGNVNVTDGQLGGIRGYRFTRTSIVDNTFDKMQQGISISQSQAAEETLASYDDVHISRNKFTGMRRMCLEVQAHKLRRWVVEDNVGSNWLGTMFWNSFGISWAADGWDLMLRRNKFTANSGGAGYCLEAGGGVNATYDSNECRSNGHFKSGVTIAYAPSAKISNNLLCGGFAIAAINYEPPHVDQLGQPAILENNSTPSTCP